jgi:hypothetical protein
VTGHIGQYFGWMPDLCSRSGYAVVGNRTDAVGVALALLEKARSG